MIIAGDYDREVNEGPEQIVMVDDIRQVGIYEGIKQIVMVVNIRLVSICEGLDQIVMVYIT